MTWQFIINVDELFEEKSFKQIAFIMDHNFSWEMGV